MHTFLDWLRLSADEADNTAARIQWLYERERSSSDSEDQRRILQAVARLRVGEDA